MLKKLIGVLTAFVLICSLISTEIALAYIDTTFDFNETETLPTELVNIESTEPAYTFGSALGYSNQANDYSLRFCYTGSISAKEDRIANFRTDGRGFRVWTTSDGTNTGTAFQSGKYVFQANFKIGALTTFAMLSNPRFNNQVPRQGAGGPMIYFYEGDVYRSDSGDPAPSSDMKIGSPGVDNWFTLGVVVDVNSSTGGKVDVYYNGEMAKPVERVSTRKNFYQFAVFTYSSNPEAHRADDANEYVYVDNLYVGQTVVNIDGYYPEVKSITPANGAVDVFNGTAVKIEFSKPMDKTKFESAFSINNGAQVDSAMWSNSDKTVTLNFESALNTSTTYTIGLSTALTDSDGMGLQTPFSSSFTTAAQGSSFSVVSKQPINEAEGVACDIGEIVYTLSQPANVQSFKDKISISPSVRIGTPKWSNGNTTLTIPLKEEFKSFTQYTVLIADGALSDTGDQLLGGKLTFTTTRGRLDYHQDFSDVLSPIVSGSNPTDKGLNTQSNDIKIASDSVQGNVANVRVYSGSNRDTFLFPYEKNALGEWENTTHNDKTVAVRFKIKWIDDYFNSDSAFSVQSVFSNSVWGPSIGISEGKFKMSGNDTGIAYTKNTWYDMGMVLKLSSTNGLVADLYFEGEKIASNVKQAAATGDLTRIRLRMTYTAHGNFYLDDIVFSENPYLFEPDLELLTEATQTINPMETLTLDFNASIKDTVLADAIKVTDSGGNEKVVQNAYLSNQSKTLRIELVGGLAPSETYTVTIDQNEMEGLSGKPLIGNNIVVFTTTEKTNALNVQFFSHDQTQIYNMVEGTITVVGNVSVLEDNAQVFIAVYDGDVLKNVIPLPAITNGTQVTSTAFSQEVTDCSATDTLKVFCWSGFGGMEYLVENKLLLPTQQ